MHHWGHSEAENLPYTALPNADPVIQTYEGIYHTATEW